MATKKPELDEKELVGAAKVLMGVKLKDVMDDYRRDSGWNEQDSATGKLQDLTLYEISELIGKVEASDEG